MKLIGATLENFRSYKNRKTISLSNITAFIGKNEHGKSSILEALEIFFNNQTVSIDQDDACISGDNKSVRISCVFEGFPEQILLDTAIHTTLLEEGLLNAQGKLEIVKIFDCSKSKVPSEIYAHASHPSNEGVNDLLSLKVTELRKRATDLGVDLTNVDQRISSALRKAIRDHMAPLTYREVEIPLNKEDSKIIWDQLQKHLPTYALFKSDRSSNEDDSEVVDPMKLAVKEALAAIEPQLDAIKEQVKTYALSVANRTIEKLREMDASIAESLALDFKAEPKWDGFKLTLADERGVPINKRGSGTRRLILLNFFRAEAERRRAEKNSPNIIFAIEEPENSQHPNYQKMLIKALLDLGEEENSQVLITTHVPALAQMISKENLIFVEKGANGEPTITVAETEDVYEKIATTLGVLPDSRVEILVFVEGPNDVVFLENMSSLICANNTTLINIGIDPRVAIIPTGGGTLKHWISEKYLQGLGRKEAHIYDLDDPTNPPYRIYVDQVNARQDGSWATLTTKREMESYLHPTAIHSVFGVNVTFNEQDDVPLIVASTIHNASGSPYTWDQLRDELKSKKISRVKRRLNSEVTLKMTEALLSQSDAQSEIEGWLRQISGILDAIPQPQAA